MATGDAPAGPVWQPALALLDDITRLTEAGAVVRTAYRTGLLGRLAEPSTALQLATAVGVAEPRMTAVLDVLRSLGIADVAADRWCLTAPWAAMVAGESPADLAGYLGMPRVRMVQFEHSLAESKDYWALSTEDRLTVARGVSFNPASPFMPDMLRRDLGLLDGVVPALEAGGRVLELGCGVGSRLTALALTFPELHGVGLELDDELVAFGRRRAAELGVGDRVTFIAGDATGYETDEPFDLVNWSQFFFPTESRAAALATAWRALRPGGWVTMPVIWPDDALAGIGEELQDYALEGLNLDIWGVPARTVGEVRAEVEAAGFVDTRVDDMTFIKLVRGRRPT